MWDRCIVDLVRLVYSVYSSKIVNDAMGPLSRYVKLRVAHEQETFSTALRVSDPGMHHGICVTHVA